MCPVAYRSRRQITFSGTVKYPSGRGAHEGRLLPLLRRSGQAQRQDLIGVPAVEVHGLRRVDDGEVRRHGDEVSAGTLFTHLDPALAKAGPLPSTNNMIEGGVNSQLGAVPRNHRGPTSAKRVKAVFRWCHAHSGDARTAREKLATMPTDADIDFLFSAYSASPSREDGGLEWGDRAVWGTSTTGTRTRSGWINGWKRMSYRDTHFAL